MKIKIAFALMVCALIAISYQADAQTGFGREGKGFGMRPLKKKTGGGGGTNFLLVNTGSVLLANTGVKILIQ